MAPRKKAQAVSYDFMGNPIPVPQNYNDYFNPQPMQPYQPVNIDVGNGQFVQQGLNSADPYTGPQVMQPMPMQQPQSSPAYSPNPDGSFTINTDYILKNLTGGYRGYNADGTYDRNTNRTYGYEGTYGSRPDVSKFSLFEEGGSLSPHKAREILHDGTINGKKITDRQRRYFGFVSGKADNGTNLNGANDQGYQNWKKSLPQNLQSEFDYDLRGLYNSNPNATPSQDLHFPDTFKLPNHPTFSNESQYYNGTQPGLGGYWNEDTYIPNPKIGPPVPPIADNGMQFNNPFVNDQYDAYNPFNQYLQNPQGPNPNRQYQPIQPLEQASYQPLQYNQQPPTATPMQQLQQQQDSNNYGSVASGIQSGVQAAGGIFSGLNNLRNQVIMGGGALINGLLTDQHNVRQKTPILADQTLAYQPQFNNMLENGGNMQQGRGLVVNSSYQPGQEVDLTPEEVANLKVAGYEFDIVG